MCVCGERERANERERERKRKKESERERECAREGERVRASVREKSTNADAVFGHLGTARAYRQQPEDNLLALLVQKYKC